MNTVQKCLFGGALIGAGLCSTATADAVDAEFVWSYTSVQAYALTGMPSIHNGDGSFEVSSSSYFGSASASGNASGLSLFAESFAYESYSRGGGGDATVNFQSYFSVTDSMSVTIDWDFTGDIFGMSYFEFDGEIYGMGGGSGSFEVDLITGQSVYIEALVSASGFGTSLIGSGSAISIYQTPAVVPVPTAAFAGLGMLAGLGAYRRVRR